MGCAATENLKPAWMEWEPTSPVQPPRDPRNLVVTFIIGVAIILALCI